VRVIWNIATPGARKHAHVRPAIIAFARLKQHEVMSNPPSPSAAEPIQSRRQKKHLLSRTSAFHLPPFPSLCPCFTEPSHSNATITVSFFPSSLHSSPFTLHSFPRPFLPNSQLTKNIYFPAIPGPKSTLRFDQLRAGGSASRLTGRKPGSAQSGTAEFQFGSYLSKPRIQLDSNFSGGGSTITVIPRRSFSTSSRVPTAGRL
jgi:hypothetical protein